MNVEWDEAKRLSNLIKHRVDFVDAQAIFDGRPNVMTLGDYPDEQRFITTGKLDDKLFTVVWTLRGSAIRLISARRARDGEERAYRAVHG